MKRSAGLLMFRRPGGALEVLLAHPGGPFEGECDPARLRCNEFELEWPPGSGRTQRHPEIDRVAWFGTAEARRRLVPAQCVFLDRLVRTLER